MIPENFTDELGQLTFRIETNFTTMRATFNMDVKDECVAAILRDIENLKKLKSSMEHQ